MAFRGKEPRRKRIIRRRVDTRLSSPERLEPRELLTATPFSADQKSAVLQGLARLETFGGALDAGSDLAMPVPGFGATTLADLVDVGGLLKTGLADVVQNYFSGDANPTLADFGACIHEGRFTWQQQGLFLVEDMGTRWEEETGSPLPLGGIVASRRLAPETLATVQQVIHDSLQFALADRPAALPTMRKYAQEFDDNVLMQHVDLYVNEWTLDLGDVGRQALAVLSARAAAAGVGKGRDIEVLAVSRAT